MNWLGPIMSLIGLGGANSAAKKEQQATNKAADFEMSLAQPKLDAQKWALPMMQKSIMRLFGGDVNKDSATLRGAHTLNTNSIDRQGALAQQESSNAWAGINPRRGAGEAFRIGMGLTDAKNKENLGYATGQQDYRDSRTSRFMSMLTGYSGLTNGGEGLAVNSSNMRADAASNRQGDVGDLFGTVAGLGLDKWLNKKKKNIYDPQTGAKL